MSSVDGYELKGSVVSAAPKTESDLDRALEDELEFEAKVRNVPTPGTFYKIQFGKGALIKTAARAYGVPLQPNPIHLARLINGHPYNRRFWRAPKTSFERKYFRDGIVDFNPNFIGSFDDQRTVASDEREPPRGGNSRLSGFLPVLSWRIRCWRQRAPGPEPSGSQIRN